MVNANTRRFFVSDNPAIFIRLFLLTNQNVGAGKHHRARKSMFTGMV